ncbi:2-succinyl-6-hydroxy-2,4-cyclohexadiene-1-carboxylate synthase [Isoptericola sp. CG 20/1183]|uniref:2-succinyl-6-hydroxy-2, 4-cyclohexadiene-1-carboxylate synthase n=1 Tax=Isoptericola halotolerans TaxID=300560 RepID=A0ABX5EDV9_9MICO|nr:MULTISPECIES: alpha/beta hydrolase [Isoptericola]PRZ06889.1 2-succinyl-6-hydroxy-2,4-cyclohexadiene-1-carboxylate synthase [Isoptericola halotolerans]PRZ07439.1 2-succinyl-6-hydroxy-2,4-cyclohexadiene-1-carboxylate synthase [Isoptericola sp. CG 20/1183]
MDQHTALMQRDAHPPVARPTTPPPGVVFVHGMRTSSAIWHAQVDHVRHAGHEAVAVDLPAHGARRTERFSMPRAFEVIDHAARSFRPGTPVVVVGLSLGGYTSLAWAAHRSQEGAADNGPELAGLVAAGCTADPRGKPVALFRDAARLAVSGTTAARRVALRTWRGPVGAGRGRPGGTEVPDPAYRPGWDVVTDALTGLAGRSSVASLRAIRAPVWLVNGARDRMRLEESRHLAAAARGALVVVPEAGHDVNTEAPAAFNHTLTRALHEFARR